MTDAGRAPHPNVLPYITPTQVVDGDKCLWRLGFSKDPKTSALDRSGPAAALGTAAHAVMVRVGDPLGFEPVWAEEVACAFGQLQAQWKPAIPPSPENWPGWSLTKIRMKKLWERTSTLKRGSCATPSRTKPAIGIVPPLPWTERWLSHRTLPLAGRPDLVERVDGALCVVDLKTGLEQSEPTPQQRVQLLLYCELVRSILGEVPSLSAIESTRGQRFTFAVDVGDVQEAVNQALTILNLINTVGEDGLSESKASPSEAACGWCSFRSVCDPFFDAYSESWQIAHALLFGVRSAKHGPHGYEVKATALKPNWRFEEEIHILGFPFDREPQPREIWAATDFVGRTSSAVAAWNTTVAKWSFEVQ